MSLAHTDLLLAEHANRFAAHHDGWEDAGRVRGLWPVAVEQAEVAADNAVGGEKECRGSIPFTILRSRDRRRGLAGG